MEIAIARHFGIRQNVIVPNVSWAMLTYEADLLIMSSSGYLTEIEIKTSKSDLKRDLQKRHQHDDSRVKVVYFALPEALLRKDGIEALVPEKAGIIEVYRKLSEWTGEKLGVGVLIKRKPKANHNTKPLTMEERYNLARLGNLRVWDLKEKFQRIKKALNS